MLHTILQVCGVQIRLPRLKRLKDSCAGLMGLNGKKRLYSEHLQHRSWFYALRSNYRSYYKM